MVASVIPFRSPNSRDPVATGSALAWLRRDPLAANDNHTHDFILPAQLLTPIAARRD
ncbi:MAG TPA: hypothetical protein VMT68_13825 [Caulobacteraceae bacterium]|nr:hypothetical protein [Caulobacteraceae bacterium]